MNNEEEIHLNEGGEKQAIEELYGRYLQVTEKMKKIVDVKQVQQRLVDCGVLSLDFDEKHASSRQTVVNYDADTQQASAQFWRRDINEGIQQKLEELSNFLGADSFRVEIVASPKPQEEIQFSSVPVERRFAEIAEKAKQLDLKCRCDNRREDYSVFEAFLTLYADSDVSASLVFRQVYESDY